MHPAVAGGEDRGGRPSHIARSVSRRWRQGRVARRPSAPGVTRQRSVAAVRSMLSYRMLLLSAGIGGRSSRPRPAASAASGAAPALPRSRSRWMSPSYDTLSSFACNPRREHEAARHRLVFRLLGWPEAGFLVSSRITSSSYELHFQADFRGGFRRWRHPPRRSSAAVLGVVP